MILKEDQTSAMEWLQKLLNKKLEGGWTDLQAATC
jgi:hypothetical protein